MAWLQNLADKAEDLLNKIDKNAATVLNDNLKNDDQLEVSNEIKRSKSISKSFAELNIELNESFHDNTSDNLGITMATPLETSQTAQSRSEESGSNPTISRQDSFQMLEEYQVDYEEKLSKLETENRSLNKQLLKVQHLYSELQNEHANVQNQLERANESVLLIQSEMEQYKSRAQKILQEKEKLILKTEQDLTQDIDKTNLNDYNIQLKKELLFQQETNDHLSSKVQSLNNKVLAIQKQYVDLQKSHQIAIQNLQDTLNNEKKMRNFAEEECRIKTKELRSALSEMADQKDMLKTKFDELNEVKGRLKESTSVIGGDNETRLHTLTQTLMVKQNALETATSERNALRIQLEKLENEYQKVIAQNQRTEIVISDVNETDDVKSQVPRFMMPSPFDAGVTRKVKKAYSSLDAVSIRTGVFLRRYPLARVFVFSYMVLVHLWMMIILCTYMPSNK